MIAQLPLIDLSNVKYNPPHPAKYSYELLPVILNMLPLSGVVVDIFGGTGERLKAIRPDAIVMDIEFDWCAIGGDLNADATRLPFASDSVDTICTSPTYGNRMADSFTDGQPQKNYDRNTYTHKLGRKLSANNTGGMNWGEDYRQLHRVAYGECFRIVKRGGCIIVNVSDHIRGGVVVPVTDWHIMAIESAGFVLSSRVDVATKRNRQGQNGGARVEFESVIKFSKVGL